MATHSHKFIAVSGSKFRHLDNCSVCGAENPNKPIVEAPKVAQFTGIVYREFKSKRIRPCIELFKAGFLTRNDAAIWASVRAVEMGLPATSIGTMNVPADMPYGDTTIQDFAKRYRYTIAPDAEQSN